jgi:hypothetical protein
MVSMMTKTEHAGWLRWASLQSDEAITRGLAHIKWLRATDPRAREFPNRWQELLHQEHYLTMERDNRGVDARIAARAA